MDDGQLTHDLNHVYTLVFVPGPLLERLESIAEYATEAVKRATFADLSDEQLGAEWAMARGVIHAARVALRRDWGSFQEVNFVDAVLRVRQIRAEALRRGVTL